MHHSNQCSVKIVSLGLLCVEDIDGMGATRNGEDGLWREEEERERERGRERDRREKELVYTGYNVCLKDKNNIILSLYRLVEVGGELDGIQSGGGDYQLQI